MLQANHEPLLPYRVPFLGFQRQVSGLARAAMATLDTRFNSFSVLNLVQSALFAGKVVSSALSRERRRRSLCSRLSVTVTGNPESRFPSWHVEKKEFNLLVAKTFSVFDENRRDVTWDREKKKKPISNFNEGHERSPCQGEFGLLYLPRFASFHF